MSEMLLPSICRRSGRVLMVEDDVLRIKERIRKGCPIVGWRGDETARLVHHPEIGFWVILEDIKGEPYVAASSENCDETLLRKLRDGDWQHGRGTQTVLDSIEAEQKRQDDEARRFHEAAVEEYVPKMMHTLLKGS